MNPFRNRTTKQPMIFGAGLLGAKGNSPENVREERLLTIERRILAIEETMKGMKA